MGILPKLSGNLGDMAIVRSMSAWALVHSLAQTWTQIGRNPAAALGDIAPNIGSIVAIEKGKEGTVFPPFVALNANAVAAPFLAVILHQLGAEASRLHAHDRVGPRIERLLLAKHLHADDVLLQFDHTT